MRFEEVKIGFAENTMADARHRCTSEGFVPGHAGSWVHPQRAGVIRDIRMLGMKGFQVIERRPIEELEAPEAAAEAMLDVQEATALAVLAEVREAVGRTYKAMVRCAWMDGNYRRDGLEKWAAQLQGIRNMFGPSWLVRARPGDLEAAAQRAKLEAKPPQLKRVLWAGQLCDVLEETESEVRIGFTNAAGLCTKLWLSRSANLYKVRED